MTGTDQAQRAEWARICVEFDTIRLDANRLGLGPWLRELSRGTANGTSSLADWQRLVEEIIRSDGVDDFTGKPGDSDGLATRLGALLNLDNPTEYVCPAGRCDRRTASSGQPPRCKLLDTRMRAV